MSHSGRRLHRPWQTPSNGPFSIRRSRGVRRVEDLVRGLLPSRTKGLPHLGVLRYQLLTAAAGTLAYAAMEGASLAVLIVHEFVTDKTSDKRHAKNAEDYNRFLHRFTGKAISNDAAMDWWGRSPYLMLLPFEVCRC